MASADDLKEAARNMVELHDRRVYTVIPTGEGRLFGIGLYLCVPIYLGIQLSVLAHHNVVNIPIMIAAVLGIVLMGVGLTYSPKRLAREEAITASMRYNKALYILIHSAAPEAVAPLLDVRWLDNISHFVPKALCRCLPLLQMEDAPLLNVAQRASLLRVLTHPTPGSLELQQVAIQAIAKIGDGTALPVLERLANGEGAAANWPVLRTEAREALYALQERIHPGYAGRNLLRASAAMATSPGELLRSATSYGETSPQELLRSQNRP